jgi:hypothetical protein
MHESSRDHVSSSTNAVPPETPSRSARWRPNASTIASAGRSHLASLTAEDKLTYRNWGRATLTFYAAFTCVIAVILIAFGSNDQSRTARNSDLHSALASTAQQNSH